YLDTILSGKILLRPSHTVASSTPFTTACLILHMRTVTAGTTAKRDKEWSRGTGRQEEVATTDRKNGCVQEE
ncbi:hypothetical protein P691DRAFT_811174, partial [Macrolepiota fuliginosa MF-IS2]